MKKRIKITFNSITSDIDSEDAYIHIWSDDDLKAYKSLKEKISIPMNMYSLMYYIKRDMYSRREVILSPDECRQNLANVFKLMDFLYDNPDEIIIKDSEEGKSVELMNKLLEYEKDRLKLTNIPVTEKRQDDIPDDFWGD